MLDSVLLLLKTLPQNLTVLLGFLMFWMPALLCLVYFTLSLWARVVKCRKARDEGKFFVSPTIGTIIWYVLVSVLPYVNLITLGTTVAPRALKFTFKWLGSMFDYQLIRPAPRHWSDKPED